MDSFLPGGDEIRSPSQRFEAAKEVREEECTGKTSSDNQIEEFTGKGSPGTRQGNRKVEGASRGENLQLYCLDIEVM